VAQGNNFDGGRELVEIQNSNPLLGNLLRRIIRSLTQISQSTGVSPVGKSDPPPTIGALNIKASGELVHATISDASPVRKGINYFLEADTDPTFPAPQVFHLGTSRTHFVNLPSLDDTGTAQNWYFQAYSQYVGSNPSRKIPFGGLAPTAITLSGSTRLTPLQSTGSGTASPTGGQGGQGFGLAPIRPPQGPKRSVGG
jgi:hypothetical protein